MDAPAVTIHPATHLATVRPPLLTDDMIDRLDGLLAPPVIRAAVAFLRRADQPSLLAAHHATRLEQIAEHLEQALARSWGATKEARQ